MLRAKASSVLPGRLWLRARTNKLPLTEKAELAERLRLTDVICVTNRPDLDWHKVNGVQYWHWPMPDGRQVPAWLGRQADFVADRLALNHGRVLIYCESGRNRCALLAGAVLVRLLGIRGSNAMAMIRAARPSALANPHFARHLEGL